MKLRIVFLTGVFVIVIVFLFIFSNFNKTPKKILLTNLNHQSATVSWITDKKFRAKVLFSEQRWRIDLPILKNILAKKAEDFKKIASQIHFVRLESLESDRNYYLQIEGEKNIRFFKTRALSEKIVQPYTAYGKILQKDGKTPAKGVIVYFEDKYSTLTNDEGNWTFDLSNLETIRDKIQVKIEGGALGFASYLLDTSKIQPSDNLILK